MVLISAGLAPKAGPFRIYAQLARRLSRDGVLTLRFDLGGIGDSQQADTNSRLRERTEADIRAAVDHLTQRYDLRELTVGGLCSGAEDAFRYAAIDPRITRIVLIDPFAYRTPGWVLRNLLPRSAKKTLRALQLHRGSKLAGPEVRASLVDYKYMEHAESSRILGKLLERKARVHFVYTGGVSDSFNHRGQLRAMFPKLALGPEVTVDHFPRLGHTQLLEGDRELLVESIAQRLQEFSFDQN
jgi:pimeloyl-ACP methyl ester carboxylesterase